MNYIKRRINDIEKNIQTKILHKEWLKVRLSDSTIRVAFSSVMQIN